MTLLDILRPKRTESPPETYGPPPELLRALTDDEARSLARTFSLGQASALQRLADTGQVTGYLMVEFQVLETQWSPYRNWLIQVARLREWARPRIYQLHLTEPPPLTPDPATGATRFACEPCPYHSSSLIAATA